MKLNFLTITFLFVFFRVDSQIDSLQKDLFIDYHIGFLYWDSLSIELESGLPPKYEEDILNNKAIGEFGISGQYFNNERYFLRVVMKNKYNQDVFFEKDYSSSLYNFNTLSKTSYRKKAVEIVKPLHISKAGFECYLHIVSFEYDNTTFYKTIAVADIQEKPYYLSLEFAVKKESFNLFEYFHLLKQLSQFQFEMKVM